MRTTVVTGAASGIGAATAALLRDRGERVIGVDLHDAEVEVDLGTAHGRAELVAAVARLSDGVVDAVIAVAGTAALVPENVAVNYFGMIATLDGVRPLLAGATHPRAVATASLAVNFPNDKRLVDAMLRDDEPAALSRATELLESPETQTQLYISSKHALARWIRRAAPTDRWAGAGIPLNAIAPGVVRTPMAPDVDTEDGRARLLAQAPMPLNGVEDPVVPGRLLAWLAGEENTHLCGQIVFVDGGADAIARGDLAW